MSEAIYFLKIVETFRYNWSVFESRGCSQSSHDVVRFRMNVQHPKPQQQAEIWLQVPRRVSRRDASAVIYTWPEKCPRWWGRPWAGLWPPTTKCSQVAILFVGDVLEKQPPNKKRYAEAFPDNDEFSVFGHDAVGTDLLAADCPSTYSIVARILGARSPFPIELADGIHFHFFTVARALWGIGFCVSEVRALGWRFPSLDIDYLPILLVHKELGRARGTSPPRAILFV